QHREMVSVGVVAEGKYLTRGGVKSPEAIFKREIEQNLWIKEHLSTGQQVGQYFLTSEYSFHSRHCAREGLVLAGDAFCFLDPVFSSGLMFAMKSGILAAETIDSALRSGKLLAEPFAEYVSTLRRGSVHSRR